ncbi:MAG: hypothetical protein HFJ38_08490, partial [Bacilli bacterium]|nr:hypothetical protein [Bacilli bacterium]
MKKIAICFLIILILTASLPITPIVQAIEKQIVSSKRIAAADETIDLTGLVTGEDTSHKHIYDRKNNESEHWQECFICHKIIGRGAHNIVQSDYSFGYASCEPGNTYTRYCSDSFCNYTTTHKDPCSPRGYYTNIAIRQLHYDECTNSKCGKWTEALNCTDANGNQITCMNPGKCVVCGHNYTKGRHYFDDTTEPGHCKYCNQQFYDIYETNVYYADDNSYATLEWKVRGMNGGTLRKLARYYLANPVKSSSRYYIENGENDITYQLKVVFDTNSQVDARACFNTEDMLRINGTPVFVAQGNKTLSAHYDRVAPSSNSIRADGMGSNGNFSQEATVTASVNENFSDVVEMRLLDKNKNVISNWGAATKNGTTFTKQFKIVAEIKEPETVYVESRDRAGNTSTQSTTVQYIDAKAPELISGGTSATNWTKNKEITYIARDQGSGQVQMAFNNDDYYKGTRQNGENYSRTYNFIGDVYGTVTAALYLKDRLGNTRTVRVKISNLDGTAPTITNVAQTTASDKKSVTATVTANDICSRLNKSGSGVTGYAITTTNTAPTSFQSSNQLTVTKNGTYYIWARDAVGNVSSPKTIQVTTIEHLLTVNPNGGSWNGST